MLLSRRPQKQTPVVQQQVQQQQWDGLMAKQMQKVDKWVRQTSNVSSTTRAEGPVTTVVSWVRTKSLVLFTCLLLPCLLACFLLAAAVLACLLASHPVCAACVVHASPSRPMRHSNQEDSLAAVATACACVSDSLPALPACDLQSHHSGAVAHQQSRSSATRAAHATGAHTTWARQSPLGGASAAAGPRRLAAAAAAAAVAAALPGARGRQQQRRWALHPCR